MERKEAIERMQALKGRNLHELAIEHNVTVLSPLGKVNKGWTVGTDYSHPSYVHDIIEFDLDEGTPLYEAVKADYDTVRNALLDPKRGFNSLTGKMGVYIQPRTKGKGHGSISRAFYARPLFLAQFIELNSGLIVEDTTLQTPKNAIQIL